MGNQLWNEDDELLQGSHPGCMSGILHALVDYHQWHSSVKNMLPYRKQDLVGDGKRDRSPRKSWNEKTKKASSTSKKSLRARIRALVSEQGHYLKRRVPRLKRTHSIHHLEPSADWVHPIIFLHKNTEIGPSKLMDYNPFAENHTDQEEKPGKLIEASVNEELVQERNLRKKASDHEDNNYVDILEMLKVNKDLFQYVLRNTDGQQSLNTKARLTKSGSFPAAYSSTGKSFRPAKLEHKQTEIFFFSKIEKLASDVRPPKLVSSKSGPLITDGSAHELNKGSFVHIRRISSLRESTDRYSQLLETSLCRLPKLHMSKSLRLTNENEIPSSSNVSMFFRRFLSFPHLENSCSTHSQESQDEKEPGGLSVAIKKYIGIDYEEGPDYVNSVVEIDEIRPRAEYSACSTEGMWDMIYPEIEVISEVPSEETSIEAQPTAVFIPESCFQEEVNINAEFHNSEGPDFRCNSFDHNESEVSSLDISSAEILQHSCHNEQPEKFDADFIYVRDILELSGFITNGLNETWYSSDHPLDPYLFEEIEYRYPYEPKCYEEGITALSHHLLLFDLVDEILFDIFERSYTLPKGLILFLPHSSSAYRTPYS